MTDVRESHNLGTDVYHLGTYVPHMSAWLTDVRECVLFIGTQFGILYTSVHPPAGAAYPIYSQRRVVDRCLYVNHNLGTDVYHLGTYVPHMSAWLTDVYNLETYVPPYSFL